MLFEQPVPLKNLELAVKYLTLERGTSVIHTVCLEPMPRLLTIAWKRESFYCCAHTSPLAPHKTITCQDLDPYTLQLEHPKQLDGQTAPTSARTTNTNHTISAITACQQESLQSRCGALQSKGTAALGGWKTLGA